MTATNRSEKTSPPKKLKLSWSTTSKLLDHRGCPRLATRPNPPQGPGVVARPPRPGSPGARAERSAPWAENALRDGISANPESDVAKNCQNWESSPQMKWVNKWGVVKLRGEKTSQVEVCLRLQFNSCRFYLRYYESLREKGRTLSPTHH